MKIKLLFLTLICMLILACGGSGSARAEQFRTSDSTYWFMVKSPITENCYELVEHPNALSIGMAEIDCKDMERKNGYN